ncbi:hypothetical protein MRX96_021645 [Rhipicephalus microplus]
MSSVEISVLTPHYMALLQSLCVITKPTLNDVTAIFKEFHQLLDPKDSKPSSERPTSSSAASGASKKRAGKSAARASAASDDGDGGAIAHSAVGFERSCTWEPDNKRCWIMSDVESWNRVLADNCIELRELNWCELALMGYQWPEKKPGDKDMLRASLLIHVLLRQHRCVTFVYLDLAHTKLERRVMWHALKTGAMGVTRLEFFQNFSDFTGVMTLAESNVCCKAIASMMSIKYLNLSRMCFLKEAVRIIGSYVEQTTSLTHMELLNIEVNDAYASLFLDHLARNRSLKALRVNENFVLAREGVALAEVVLNHVTLETLHVNGSTRKSPTALLAAVAQSHSLQWFTLLGSYIDPADIEALAADLAIPSKSFKLDAEVIGPAPTSRLQKLHLTNCGPFTSRLEEACAKLIGGVLVELKLGHCGLNEVFASLAAKRLLHDRRLRELNLEDNNFSMNSIRSIVEVLQVNKRLEALVLNMTMHYLEEDVTSLFDMIHRIDAFSRLWIHWVYPRASEFTKCIPYGPHLMLTMIRVPDAVVVDLFRALERNQTIFMIEFSGITFSKRNAKALGRLVELNRAFISLTFDLRQSDPRVDRMVQCRAIIRELKEALRKNRFLITVRVNTGNADPSCEPAIKHFSRRNSALINQAVRFVYGSMDKSDALAFELLQHCASVSIRMETYAGLSMEAVLEKIAEARQRLALNYFILTGVVKVEIVCQRSRKAIEEKVTFLDDIGRVLQARVCSYLGLTDVMDI